MVPLARALHWGAHTQAARDNEFKDGLESESESASVWVGVGEGERGAKLSWERDSQRDSEGHRALLFDYYV